MMRQGACSMLANIERNLDQSRLRVQAVWQIN